MTWRKKYAANPAEREKVCDHPLGFPYRGRIPCTGPRVCPMCGANKEDAERQVELLELQAAILSGHGSEEKVRRVRELKAALREAEQQSR